MAARRLTQEKADERRQAKSQRKVEQLIRMDAVSGAGMSLIQKLEAEAVQAARDYLEAKHRPSGPDVVDLTDPELELRLKRGILRGIVVGVAMIRTPYELADNRAEVLKKLEREFVRKAKNDA